MVNRKKNKCYELKMLNKTCERSNILQQVSAANRVSHKDLSRDLLLGSQEEGLNSKTLHSLKVDKYSGKKEERRGSGLYLFFPSNKSYSSDLLTGSYI